MFRKLGLFPSSGEIRMTHTLVGPKVNVFLRSTVSRPVRFGVRHPSGKRDQFFFLLEIFFRQLRICYFVAPTLTRGRVCNIMLLLVLASVVPRDSGPYFIVPVLESLPTWSVRSPFLYPPGTGWPSYTPRHWVPFYRLLRLARLRWRYSNPPPHGASGILEIANLNQLFINNLFRIPDVGQSSESQ
jgi:hypothetical protein